MRCHAEEEEEEERKRKRKRKRGKINLKCVGFDGPALQRRHGAGAAGGGVHGDPAAAAGDTSSAPAAAAVPPPGPCRLDTPPLLPRLRTFLQRQRLRSRRAPPLPPGALTDRPGRSRSPDDDRREGTPVAALSQVVAPVKENKTAAVGVVGLPGRTQLLPKREAAR